MWGEIHKTSDMISLYHFNETSGTSHDDAMGNYDLTSGDDVTIEGNLTKSRKALSLTPPNNNDFEAGYITDSDSDLSYQDIENLRTVGVWIYPEYSDSVYRSYGEPIVEIEKDTTYGYKPLSIYKKGYWDGSNLEDTFNLYVAVNLVGADNYMQSREISTGQIYEYNKPYYLFFVFKPSDSGTNNGYIRLYVNFVLAAELDDPGDTDDRWLRFYTDSNDRGLFIGTNGYSLPQGNTIFRGEIDEVFLSKEVYTQSKIKQIQREWKNSFII